MRLAHGPRRTDRSNIRARPSETETVAIPPPPPRSRGASSGRRRRGRGADLHDGAVPRLADRQEDRPPRGRVVRRLPRGHYHPPPAEGEEDVQADGGAAGALLELPRGVRKEAGRPPPRQGGGLHDLPRSARLGRAEAPHVAAQGALRLLSRRPRRVQVRRPGNARPVTFRTNRTTRRSSARRGRPSASNVTRTFRRP